MIILKDSHFDFLNAYPLIVDCHTSHCHTVYLTAFSTTIMNHKNDWNNNNTL
jgi:hypothetical protein